MKKEPQRKNEYKSVGIFKLTNIETGEQIKGYGREHAAHLIGVGVTLLARASRSKQACRGWYIEETGIREKIKSSDIEFAKNPPKTARYRVVNRKRNTIEFSNTLENCAEYIGIRLCDARDMLRGKITHRTYDLRVVE